MYFVKIFSFTLILCGFFFASNAQEDTIGNSTEAELENLLEKLKGIQEKTEKLIEVKPEGDPSNDSNDVEPNEDDVSVDDDTASMDNNKLFEMLK